MVLADFWSFDVKKWTDVDLKSVTDDIDDDVLHASNDVGAEVCPQNRIFQRGRDFRKFEDVDFRIFGAPKRTKEVLT